MACNKGRSKFSYNLWEQRIKKREKSTEGEGAQKKQLQNGMLYAFPLRRRLINISNPSQNATTRRAGTLCDTEASLISFDPISSALAFALHLALALSSRAVPVVIPAVNSLVDPPRS